MRKFEKKARAEASSIPTSRLALEKQMLELRLRQKGISQSGIQTIARRKKTDPCPLSFAQERLWFLHQWEPESSWYNVPIVLRLCGQLEVSALEWSLAIVVQRHEVLRTTLKNAQDN
jgi:hypothetical protein